MLEPVGTAPRQMHSITALLQHQQHRQAPLHSASLRQLWIPCATVDERRDNDRHRRHLSLPLKQET